MPPVDFTTVFGVAEPAAKCFGFGCPPVINSPASYFDVSPVDAADSLTDIMSYVPLDAILPAKLDEFLTASVVRDGFKLGFLVKNLHGTPVAFYPRELFGGNVTKEYLDSWKRAYTNPLGSYIEPCVALYVPFHDCESAIVKFCLENNYVATTVTRDNAARAKYLTVAGMLYGTAITAHEPLDRDNAKLTAVLLRRGYVPALVKTFNDNTRVCIPRSAFATGISDNMCCHMVGFLNAGYEHMMVQLSPTFVQDMRRQHLTYLKSHRHTVELGLMPLPVVNPMHDAEPSSGLAPVVDTSDVKSDPSPEEIVAKDLAQDEELLRLIASMEHLDDTL